MNRTTEILRDIYETSGNVYKYLHDDFVLYSPGASLIAGTFHGADGMREHFALMKGLTNDTLHHALQGTYLADEKWGMVVHRLTATRDDGRALDTWGFGLSQFEGERVVGHWESVGDPVHWEEFWS